MRVAVLGATGSVGSQALQVIHDHPDLFELAAISLNTQVKKAASIAHAFGCRHVGVANEQVCLSQLEGLSVYRGISGIKDMLHQLELDCILLAVVGSAAIPLLAESLALGVRVACANKEAIVAAGKILLPDETSKQLIPVDSEHSAIFQCLETKGDAALNDDVVDTLWLTCSGGPFKGFTKQRLARVTQDDALKHPTWNMGAKITLDSATLMNKGFEVIEAAHLFHIAPHKIKVLIHPESTIHSLVNFKDNSCMAQLATTSMQGPIAYALTYPSRSFAATDFLDLYEVSSLTFERPDVDAFPCLGLAYEALRQGGIMPCVLNAANEVANRAFRQGRISFLEIPRIIEEQLAQTPYEDLQSIEQVLCVDTSVQNATERAIERMH